MAVIKAVNSRACLGHALRYILQKKKTEERLIGGVNCDPRNALQEMQETKHAWGKTGGREYKHFIQSFPPDEDITAQQANEIAEELITRSSMFDGYEVAYATHVDRHHVHTHIIVNSVSFENGKKFRQSRRDLQDFKDLSDEILRERGLSVCTKSENISSFRMGMYRVLEQDLSGEKHSWMVDIIRAVESSLKQARDKDSFIQAMKACGIETQWTNRKHIVFRDSDGRKVRASTLSKTFKIEISKEVLETEIHGLHAGLVGSGERNEPQGCDNKPARPADGRYPGKHPGSRKSATQRELGGLRKQLAQLSGQNRGQSECSGSGSDREAQSASDIKRDAVPKSQSARRSVRKVAEIER